MKILLLHPRDKFHLSRRDQQWDLVVDLGRAPTPIYELWSNRAACPVISIYDFAEEGADLLRAKALLQPGRGHLMDRWGNDWWSLLSVEILPEIQQLMLVHRLTKYVNKECDVYSSRSDYRSAALNRLLGGRLINLETSLQVAQRRFRHYTEVASKFDLDQIFQIVQDKFDRVHSIRRRLANRRSATAQPLILLPSAYVNVSRTAVSYAALLPDEQFLLVCARDNARVTELPSNVEMTSLDSYFSPPNSEENVSLLETWEALRLRLISSAPEYQFIAAVGLLDRMPSLIRWGTTIRDAWRLLFESQDIRSCLCADHSNPYTKIPLLLAKHAGIPSLACHHGALDSWMAITPPDADFYLAKTEMEHDYMTRVCGIAPRKVFCVPPRTPVEPASPISDSPRRPWLVFFSEPYNSWSWRTDDVYAELLPRLRSLAETCGLKLVFKLHPFETVKGHRRLLRRHLPARKAGEIEVIAGPTTEQFWRNTRVAITVQSSIAMECTDRGIPIFLCGWLRDLSSGYVEQFTRFGVGHLLNTVTEIDEIPRILESQLAKFRPKPSPPGSIGAETLRGLLAASHPMPVAMQG